MCCELKDRGQIKLVSVESRSRHQVGVAQGVLRLLLRQVQGNAVVLVVTVYHVYVGMLTKLSRDYLECGPSHYSIYPCLKNGDVRVAL